MKLVHILEYIPTVNIVFGDNEQMKAIDLLKITAVAVFTAGIAVGCASTGDIEDNDEAVQTADESQVVEQAVEICEEPTPEVKSAIYAAKLKNARVRNLGYEWRETAQIIEEAEEAIEACEPVRAKILAEKAEDIDAEVLDQHQANYIENNASEETGSANSGSQTGNSSDGSQTSNSSSYMDSYRVVNGDNLWDISGQASVYGNPYQWPLIYKANMDQIDDADLIYPGQYFNIPNATAADSAAAIEHAKMRGFWSIGEIENSDLQYLD